MFETLTPQPPDAIMALLQACKADPNPDKIDLGVGVYKDASGATTIMKAVKQAEQLWWGEEQSKGYIGTTGNAQFCRHMLELILGADNPALPRIASAQAAGGSGALRLGAELIAAAKPDCTVWASTPTWANHIPLISSAGLKMDSYPYYNRESLGVDFDDMIAHLDAHAQAGDVVLLHGCCHNPTGADLSPVQWDRLSGFMVQKGLIAYVDLAYYGLGQGLEADSYGLKRLVQSGLEVMMAVSCSKNFALYRERTGLVAVLCQDEASAAIAQSQFGALQRRIISMPPDHGAALVTRILGDAELRKTWHDELEAMRMRIEDLRGQLSTALNVQGGEAIAAAVTHQNGMFSTLPLSQAQVLRLRDEQSIYMTNSGRINIAGANQDNIPRLAEAILAVL